MSVAKASTLLPANIVLLKGDYKIKCLKVACKKNSKGTGMPLRPALFEESAIQQMILILGQRCSSRDVPQLLFNFTSSLCFI